MKHKIFSISNGHIVENQFFVVVLQRLYYEGRRGFSNFLLMNTLQPNLHKNSLSLFISNRFAPIIASLLEML